MAASEMRALVAGSDGLAGDDESPLDQALAAVRRLAQASVVLLATYRNVSGGDPVVRQAGAIAGSGQAADLLASVVDARAGWPVGQTRWSAQGKQGGATLCVKVVEDRLQSSFLLLAFADATAVAHARVSRLAPDLVALVAAQLAAAARLSDVQERQAAATVALDHGACGVIALRADHTMLFANAAAAAILADGGSLQVRRGLVRPSDYRQAVRFEAALDAVLERSHAAGIDRPPALVMLLPHGLEDRPTIVVITPAATPAGLGDGAEGKCALIYLLRPGSGLTRGVETLAQLHGLSRVETRLLAHLCEGMTVGESATQMRIKLETARAYLKQIFAKTGTHRQTELVALMSRYLRAVRGDFEFQAA